MKHSSCLSFLSALKDRINSQWGQTPLTGCRGSADAPASLSTRMLTSIHCFFFLRFEELDVTPTVQSSNSKKPEHPEAAAMVNSKLTPRRLFTDAQAQVCCSIVTASGIEPPQSLCLLKQASTQQADSVGARRAWAFLLLVGFCSFSWARCLSPDSIVAIRSSLNLTTKRSQQPVASTMSR